MKQVAKIKKVFSIAFSVLILLIFGGMIIRAAMTYRSDPGLIITVNEQGTCKQVVNTGASGKSYFIPTNTSNEWNLFLQYKPSDVNLSDCYTYSWQAGGWGACSISCGSGTQSRSVWCQRSDGAMVDDSYCGGGKQAGSQECYTEAGCSWQSTSGEGVLGESCNSWLLRTGQSGVRVRNNAQSFYPGEGNCIYEHIDRTCCAGAPSNFTRDIFMPISSCGIPISTMCNEQEPIKTEVFR